MNIQANAPAHLFIIEDVLAFTESRPDEEKWALAVLGLSLRLRDICENTGVSGI
jgi:hypothetical protein